jgi:hypothetical protein
MCPCIFSHECEKKLGIEKSKFLLVLTSQHISAFNTGSDTVLITLCGLTAFYCAPDDWDKDARKSLI